MAKRETRPGGGSRKAPGVRKPKKTVAEEIPKETGEHCPLPPYHEELHDDGGMTINQERFVDAYIECNFNATEAYFVVYGGERSSAATLGTRLLRKQEIKDAIERRQMQMRIMANVTREKMIRVQAAMAFTTFDEVLEVFKHPSWDDSYRNLGDKRYAIKSARQHEFGNEVTLTDRQEALNELWDKLGFKKGSDSADSETDTSGIYNDVIEILSKRAIK